MTAPKASSGKPLQSPRQCRKSACGWTKVDGFLCFGFVICLVLNCVFVFLAVKSEARSYGHRLSAAKCKVQKISHGPPVNYSECEKVQKRQDKGCWFWSRKSHKNSWHHDSWKKNHDSWKKQAESWEKNKENWHKHAKTWKKHDDSREHHGMKDWDKMKKEWAKKDWGMKDWKKGWENHPHGNQAMPLPAKPMGSFPCLQVHVEAKVHHCENNQHWCKRTALLHATMDQMDRTKHCSHDKCNRDYDDDDDYKTLEHFEHQMKEYQKRNKEFMCTALRDEPFHIVHMFNSKHHWVAKKFWLGTSILSTLGLIFLVIVGIRRCVFCCKKPQETARVVTPTPQVITVSNECEKKEQPEDRLFVMSPPPPYEVEKKQPEELDGPVVTA